VSLAEALGWPYEAKTMAYNRLNRLPNLMLGASLLSVRRDIAHTLRPPWPDLVIAASRRSVPVARWIRSRSEGRTKLVQLLHAMAPLDLFDLVITTPQYRLPPRPNLLHLSAVLNRIDPARLAASAARWAPRFETLPRPHLALFVGGNSATYRLDVETARKLGERLSAAVAREGGSLLVSTSPRTPPPAAEALNAAIACPHVVYRWKPDDPDNPYHAFLASADRFVVTADSASLLVEACLTGKPVEVFDLPLRQGPLARCKDWLWRRSGAGGLAPVVDRLVYCGLLKPPRDFAALHRELQARGLISRFGQAAAASVRRPLDDMERAVAAIRHLFEPGA